MFLGFYSKFSQYGWLAHALGSDMDSKNNKNPYTVIFFSLYV
jgi:hypothetical protein